MKAFWYKTMITLVNIMINIIMILKLSCVPNNTMTILDKEDMPQCSMEQETLLWKKQWRGHRIDMEEIHLNLL